MYGNAPETETIGENHEQTQKKTVKIVSKLEKTQFSKPFQFVSNVPPISAAGVRDFGDVLFLNGGWHRAGHQFALRSVFECSDI